jgi:hypothetical protein
MHGVLCCCRYNLTDDLRTQCLVTAFFFFGWLLERMFCEDLTFVFDPNTDNWRRKVDPQS